jgi:hypothetical protein
VDLVMEYVSADEKIALKDDNGCYKYEKLEKKTKG